MSIEKNMNTRIQHKHDIEANWNKALNFIPKIGEIIIYDIDDNYNYSRFKIGDGVRTVNNLEFLLDTQYILHNSNTLSQLLEQYIFNIDYNTTLAFDTSEIVFGNASTTSILGQAILGQMVLGSSVTTTSVLGQSAIGQIVLA